MYTPTAGRHVHFKDKYLSYIKLELLFPVRVTPNCVSHLQLTILLYEPISAYDQIQ